MPGHRFGGLYESRAEQHLGRAPLVHGGVPGGGVGQGELEVEDLSGSFRAGGPAGPTVLNREVIRRSIAGEGFLYLLAYENGRLDFTALLEAQRQIRKARQEQLKAQAEAQVRLAEIERIVGEAL